MRARTLVACFYSRSMSTAEWRPLSWRLGGGQADTAWREEVPAALEEPLRAWVDRALRGAGNVFHYESVGGQGITERVMLRLNLVLPDYEADEDEEGEGSRRDAARRFLAYNTIVNRLPDVVDAVLYLLPVPVPGEPSDMTTLAEDPAQVVETWPADLHRRLAMLLHDALSVLRLRADGRGLERRADVLSEAAFAEAIKGAEAAPTAGSAASHLRAAWDCVYALHSDPVKAYGEAIKAVEAAAQAVLQPNNRAATLGTMRGHLRSNRERFSLAIAGPDGQGDTGPLIECLSLLWTGQSSRHGSSAPTRAETHEEARMAVHLAVMLVQWFTSGAVRPALRQARVLQCVRGFDREAARRITPLPRGRRGPAGVWPRHSVQAATLAGRIGRTTWGAPAPPRCPARRRGWVRCCPGWQASPPDARGGSPAAVGIPGQLGAEHARQSVQGLVGARDPGRCERPP